MLQDGPAQGHVLLHAYTLRVNHQHTTKQLLQQISPGQGLRTRAKRTTGKQGLHVYRHTQTHTKLRHEIAAMSGRALKRARAGRAEAADALAALRCERDAAAREVAAHEVCAAASCAHAAPVLSVLPCVGFVFLVYRVVLDSCLRGITLGS